MSVVKLRSDQSIPKKDPLRFVLVGAQGPMCGTAKKKEWSALEPRWQRLDGSTKAGATVLLDADPNIRIVGVGEPEDWFAAGQAIGRSLDHDAWMRVKGTLPDAFIEGIVLGSYRFTKKTANDVNAARSLTFVGGELPTRSQVIAGATVLARDLANTTSNVKTPAWLVRKASAIPGVQVKRFTRAELAAFGGLQAVAAGSKHGPEFVTMRYRPPSESKEHVVIVGKGITFDSGGLSLKPADAMTMMKTDMSGAAAVIGVMSAVAELGIGVAVTGVLAIAENMPGANAMRPGDVITHFGGRTSEVLNTDAEGRLVLADALAYSAAKLAPTTIIDLATLTGAATLALGRGRGAVFSNNERLAKSLVAAGEQSRDLVWQLPLERDYEAAIASPVADAANSATDPKAGAGAITAALFLEPFVAGKPWAHLDIAGPARNEKERSATGFGVRLLLDWLSTRS